MGVSFTLLHLTIGEISASKTLDRRLDGPLNWSWPGGKEKNLCPSQESNPSCLASHFTDLAVMVHY
jgi:hypothetical protein